MILAGMAAVALLGIFDTSTGIEVPLSMFYLLPVMLISWYVGKGSGILMSFLSALSYFVTHYHHWIPQRTLMLLTADSAARLVFYSALSFISASLRLYLERQYQLARTDSLTGAANPRRFYEQAELELVRSRR